MPHMGLTDEEGLLMTVKFSLIVLVAKMELKLKKPDWKYTLEPVLFLGYLTFSILNGAEVQTNLLMWKVNQNS